MPLVIGGQNDLIVGRHADEHVGEELGAIEFSCTPRENVMSSVEEWSTTKGIIKLNTSSLSAVTNNDVWSSKWVEEDLKDG